VIQDDANTINRLILGDGSCQFLFEFAILNTGRPDKIDRLVLLFFAAGRPFLFEFAIFNTGRSDKIDRLVLLFFAAGRPYMSNVMVSNNS